MRWTSDRERSEIYRQDNISGSPIHKESPDCKCLKRCQCYFLFQLRRQCHAHETDLADHHNIEKVQSNNQIPTCLWRDHLERSTGPERVENEAFLYTNLQLTIAATLMRFFLHRLEEMAMRLERYCDCLCSLLFFCRWEIMLILCYCLCGRLWFFGPYLTRYKGFPSNTDLHYSLASAPFVPESLWPMPSEIWQLLLLTLGWATWDSPLHLHLKLVHQGSSQE